MQEQLSETHVLVIMPADPSCEDPRTMMKVEEFLSRRFPNYAFKAISDWPFRAPDEFMIMTVGEGCSIPSSVLSAALSELKHFDIAAAGEMLH